ncbi:MAG TPA: hypothetical protein VGB91_06790 [Rhizomicrobium sp.]
MARKTKVKTARVKLKTAARPIRLADEGDCNDPTVLTTSVSVPFGNPQPRPNCGTPSATEEGDAMDAAKDAFKAIAAAYCAKGKCHNPSPGCLSTVSNLALENLGVVAVGEGEMKKCAIKFKVTGSIACHCGSTV